MTMKYSLSLTRGPVIPDGVSATVTVDFSEDIRVLSRFANASPSGLLATHCDVTDASGTPIAFTATRHGKRVTWTFTSVPPELGQNGAPNAFNAVADFLFDSD